MHAYNGWRAKVYKPAAAAVGLGEDAIPYDLRGSFASLLIWEGRTMLEVVAQLGHSVAVCEQHYAHVFASDDRRSARPRSMRSCRPAPDRRKPPCVTAAIFTLAGVIVGAVATGMIQWLSERRQEERELRVAARATQHNLVILGAVLAAVEDAATEFDEDIANYRDWARRCRASLEHHEATLANRLSSERWWSLVMGFGDGLMYLERGDPDKRRWDRAVESVNHAIRAMYAEFPKELVPRAESEGDPDGTPQAPAHP
jgi:uncharacterized membrane protein